MKKVLLIAILVIGGGVGVIWSGKTNNSISNLQKANKEQAQSLQELQEGSSQQFSGLNPVTNAGDHDHATGKKISTEGLADGAVTTAKVLDGTITTADLASDVLSSLPTTPRTVTASQLANGAVITAKILDGSVTSSKLANGAVTESRLADGAVTSAKIADGTIVAADIANGTITSNKFAPGAVGEASLTDGSVTTNKLADGAVTSQKVADGTLTNADVASSAAVALSKLASGTSGQVIVANASGVPTYVSMSGDIAIDNAGVTSIASNSIVNADINSAAAIALTKLASGTSGQVIVANVSGVPTYVSMSGDVTISNTGVTDLGAGVVTNADINSSAAIALSKLASGTNGQIIVANVSGVPTYVSMSGDMTIDNAGVTSIASNSIVNADINSAAAIALTKLASGTSGQVIVANVSGVPTYVSMSGDVTISNTGATTIATNAIGTNEVDATLTNADLAAGAAIALSKLASGTDGQIIVANASGVPTYVSMSGDITVSNAGVTAIGSGVIVNADISGSAAIALSKLASGTSAQIVVANASGVPTYVTMSGDVTIADTGATTIAGGAVTAAKLSTATRKNVVAVQIGDVAAATATERPAFVAPGNGTIVGVSFTNATAITQNDANYTTLSVERKTATAGQVRAVTTQVTGGVAFTAFAPQRFTTGLSNTTLAAGDTYSFKKADTGTGAAIDEMLVTVEYTVSE